MNTTDNVCPKCQAPIPAEAPQGLCPKCVLSGAATSLESRPTADGESDVPSLERVVEAFPQLEIVELVGRGGMGFVYKARQPHLDRFVALKLLPDKLAQDPQFAERFNQEGRVLARLNHPSVVSVFDFGRTEHFYFLLMEYVDGANLRQAMQAGRFSPSEALVIVPKICEALQYAHEQGVLHRDIKPENILLDSQGRLKIADFGIAKLMGEKAGRVTLTNTGSALGTPHYMAPEQLEKPSDVDQRADIYSLGVVFYEMLTGELPIGRFGPPSAKTPVSAGVDEAVLRALERDRERRQRTATEFKTQVETGAREAPAVHPTSATRWSQKAIWSAVLVSLSVLVLGAPIAVAAALGGGLGLIEVFIVGLPGAMAALAGTILGWMAVSDLRGGRGTVKGLPMAVFGALAWPLLVLVMLMMVPAVVAFPVGEPSWTQTLGHLLVWVWPAGIVVFILWTIHATVRWTRNQPIGRRRGVLKWVIAGVLVVGLGIALISNSGLNRSTQPVVSNGERPASAGASVTFTAVELRRQDDQLRLVLEYHEEQGGQLVWVTSGRFNGTPVDLRTSSELQARGPGDPFRELNSVGLLLPDNMDERVAEQVRKRVAARWEGKELLVHPGDDHSILTIPAPGGGEVKVSVVRK